MLSRYDIFCKVIETGSFTRAAEQLGYSQSAVSQTVKALERELDAALVSRDKEGIRLTADGAAYFPYIRSISAAGDALEKKHQEMLGLENTTIRIGTFTSVSRNLLPKLIQEFKTQYPNVQFELVQGEYSSISQWVQEETVDFGFVNAEFSTGLDVRPLFQDAMMAILPPDHPLTARSAVPLDELAAEPFILLDEGRHSVAIDAFQLLGLTPRIEYKVSDDYSILAMVKQGLGVSILYNLMVAGFCDGLVVRPILEHPERTVALAARRWETMSLAARRFAEFIPRHIPKLLTELMPNTRI